MSKNKKTDYVAPECDVVELRTEGVIAASSGQEIPGFLNGGDPFDLPLF